MCPDGLIPQIDRTSWTPLPVFDWLQSVGHISDDEMHKTFNMGIGMVLAVSADKTDAALAMLRDLGETPVLIGELAAQ